MQFKRNTLAIKVFYKVQNHYKFKAISNDLNFC